LTDQSNASTPVNTCTTVNSIQIWEVLLLYW